jgi:LmbE family N-acetylglucosaminyl deacetylase
MTEGRAPRPAAALCVLAHHDDEVFCAGHLRRALAACRRVGIVWATAGGLASARRRRAEGARVCRLLGLGPAAVRDLALPDQGAVEGIAAIADATESLLDSVAGGPEARPAVVYVPAYEGGHPDHDAVNVAVALVRRRHPHVAAREFPLYRRGPAGISVQARRPAPGTSATAFDVLRLDDEDLALRRSLACANASQLLPSLLPLRAVAWAEGGGRAEPSRGLPDHDYARPPHGGALLYELYTRRRFRDFREHALAALR